MTSIWGSRRNTTIAFLLLFAALIPVFQSNIIRTAPEPMFSSWERFSESLVLGEIESKRAGEDAMFFGLTGVGEQRETLYATIEQDDLSKLDAFSFDAYPAQIGLSGHLYSALYFNTPCSSLNCMQFVSSALFAAVLTALTFLLGILTRRAFAIAFLLSIVGSPWLVTAGRNLYWSPWTWLLPVVAAAIYCLVRSRLHRAVSLSAVGLAFAIRFAMGYEFITSMALMAAILPFLALAFAGKARAQLVWWAVCDSLKIMATAVTAFIAVVVVHAYFRGQGSLIDGLRSIIESEVLKRTYGSADGFDDATAQSLEASPFYVLQLYFSGWQTDVIKLGDFTPFGLRLGGGMFWPLIVGALAVVVYHYFARDERWKRDAILFGTSAVIPLSWLILAKSHSYVHTPINFVLWYLFFIGALLYVVFDFIATRRPVLGMFELMIRESGESVKKRAEEARAG